MLNPNLIPDNVLTAILQNKDWPEDEAGYSKVAQLSPIEAFESFLHWHGIIGYERTIISALDGLREAEVIQH